MVNISQFYKDMQSEMTIPEVLEKHNISFKEACDLLTRKNKGIRRKKRQKKRYESTGEKYIHKQNNKYFIRRSYKGTTRSYGGYYTLKDAVKVRDYMIRNGWYKNRLKSTCKKLNVRYDG